MKILSRDFTRGEKILILILCLILVVLAYYWIVYKPCRKAVEDANAERDALQIELMAAQSKEDQLKKMKDELDRLGSLEETTRMESYNNTNAELTLLNNVLRDANTYYIDFSDVTRNGDQIRRNFTLQFTTYTFDTAKKIIHNMAESEYRCLIGDIRASVTPYYSYYVWNRVVEDGNYDVVTVNATATFFETMYGGKPDAGLPADSAAVKAG